LLSDQSQQREAGLRETEAFQTLRGRAEDYEDISVCLTLGVCEPVVGDAEI